MNVFGIVLPTISSSGPAATAKLHEQEHGLAGFRPQALINRGPNPRAESFHSGDSRAGR